MSTSWVPAKLQDFIIFAANFSALITALPGKYGLAAGDAVTIAASVAAFNVAVAASTNAGTRTKVTVANTQIARNSLTTLIRAYGMIIKANKGVLDGDKIALGIRLNDSVPTPLPPPSTSPILGVNGATPGELTMTYRDSAAAPKSRAKPAGVAFLQLAAAASATVVSDPAQLPVQAQVTKTPFALTTAAADKGKTIYLAGRWLNRKGVPGPWSAIATFIVV